MVRVSYGVSYGPFLLIFMRWVHRDNRDRKRGWDVGLRCSRQKWLSNHERRWKHVNHMRRSTAVYHSVFRIPNVTTKAIKYPSTGFLCWVKEEEERKKKKKKKKRERWTKIRWDEEPQFKVQSRERSGKDSLAFDLVTRRRGHCTSQHRFRSRDPLWRISVRMILDLSPCGKIVGKVKWLVRRATKRWTEVLFQP